MPTPTHRSEVAKWGNSLAARIPRDAARKLGRTEGCDINVVMKDQSLAIRRTHRVAMLDVLLKGVTPENAGGEIDWEPAVGREVW
jgi:antitoxin MazE